MTLHWWMHWFWITCQFSFCILLTHSMPVSPVSTLPSELDTEQTRPLRRPVKSIGQTTVPKSQVSITIPFPDTSDTSDISVGEPVSQLYKTKVGVVNTEKVLCVNYGQNASSVINSTTELKNATLLLCSKKNATQLTLPNESATKASTMSTEMTTEIAEVDVNATTDTDVTKDLFVNNTLTSVVVTKELISAKVSNEEDPAQPTLTAVSITGISFGVLVFAAFIGVTSFLLYRRRYLNKPQTLNDKCSNPDSSGYIDDSTMRENSEEMYSLDNDSFLNSLEAMTIQNYWTDSVKHTKL